MSKSGSGCKASMAAFARRSERLSSSIRASAADRPTRSCSSASRSRATSSVIEPRSGGRAGTRRGRARVEAAASSAATISSSSALSTSRVRASRASSSRRRSSLSTSDRLILCGELAGTIAMSPLPMIFWTAVVERQSSRAASATVKACGCCVGARVISYHQVSNSLASAEPRCRIPQPVGNWW